MLSWLKPSSSASSPAETATPVPVAQEADPAVVLPPPGVPSSSASPPQPQPTSPSPPTTPPRPSRKEVNPNAPYVILACAGTAVGVGVLIGLRRVRQLQAKTVELSAAAAAAEAAEATAAGGGAPAARAAGSIVAGARPGRTSSILTKGSLAGVRTTPPQAASGNPFKSVAAAVKGPEDALSGGPSSKPLSDATASLLRKPAPAPGSAPARQPLFPPSSARAAPTATAPSPSASAAPAGTTNEPSAVSATPAAPKATLRSLIKEGRKKDVDEAEELPPMTTAVMLRAAAAFGMATGLAALLVGGPFAAACWWLGVEEPADFTPMFRRKIVTIFPSLEEGLLREEAEAAAAAAAAAASPDATSPSSSAKISFADYLPAALRHSPADGVPAAEAAPSSYIPSILHQGAAPEGEEEHSVYTWFEGVKDEFEKDRLAEVRRRAEDDKFFREWEEKQRREGR